MSELVLLETGEKPRKRLFETGEMKLLVLHFISLQPKYSYDIIKDVANLVGDNYKPSTGTICPTIHYLEEQQYTSVQMTEDQRKQYHITQAGIDYLNTQQQALQKVLYRFNARHHIQNDAEYIEIKHAMECLKVAIRQNLQHAPLTPEQISHIARQIQQAATHITHIANEKITS